MFRRSFTLIATYLLCGCGVMTHADDAWVTYAGGDGPGSGKHIVLISGDEEYRSEEGLPQLGKILAARHGFDCTVLFAIDPDTREIAPNQGDNIPGIEALEDADLMIILTRFRHLPDEQMKYIDAYLRAGRPVMGMRTSTHAFNTDNPNWAHYSNNYGGEKTEWKGGFGRLVLGEKWISHHGHHKKESTRGVIAPQAEGHPIVRGIGPGEIWGDTDVYGVRLPLPGDSQPIVLGQVLSGMNPNDPPVEGKKNNPLLPVVWTKHYQLPGGKQGQAFNTTMGAATDLATEGTRRMLVNAVYWILGMDDQIPESGTAVDLVGDYKPSAYGFNGYTKGVKPSDHALDTTKIASRETGESAQAAARLTLRKGDHISIVGNTLGERMQHDGWLEALLQYRFPKHELVVRNMAFSADTLTVRQRSAGFGTPDEWLTNTQTNVVFAFWGFNESFAGKAGLEKFKHDLAEFIQHTRDQAYHGDTAPRLVLFTPIAFENLHTPNLPDGRAENKRLAMYAQAMAEIAKANNVPLVDLFTASRKLYAQPKHPLTFNGIHLNEQGNRLIAEVIDSALFGAASSQGDAAKLEAIRQAALDKNFFWFHRYRATDGYSSYGGRSYLKFVDDQTNRDVMTRELEIIVKLADNRDPLIWAAAQGTKLDIDVDDTPPFIPVKTNKPGTGPNGEHVYLGGEEAIEKMTLAKGMQVNLYASEEMFPELINPVQMAWSPAGQLWVGTWPSYPHWKPKTEMNDRLLILRDTDGDGKADRCDTFADHLHNPTGFEFWGGGVLVAMAPDLLFLKDTDGDGRADVRQRILHGLDSADTHHTANSFTLDPGGALYFQEGVFHRTQVETPYGPVRNLDACVWRYNPRTANLQRYASYGFANPHGHVFDGWGQDIVHDGTGAQAYPGAVFSGHIEFPHKHPRAPQVYNQRTRPCSATEILSSKHFPDENQGNLLVGNVIGFQGILQYKLDESSACLTATEVEPILSSSDPNFRPVDIEVGPDGAIYFTDWQNPVIGHMQHNIRDPSRDVIHGRVYRVTYKDRALTKPVPIAGQPIDALLERLKETENRVRYRARIELSGRDTKEVIAAVERWVETLGDTPADEHHRLEALWVHQHHNVVNQSLLNRLLESPDFRARAAATRVLCYWRERIPSALALLRTLATDQHARVRLEAIRAASFFTEPEAVEIAVMAAQLPTDRFLSYTHNETMRTLEPHWRKALDQGRSIAMTTEAGNRFLVGKLSLDQLLARPRTPIEYRELLTRPGVQGDLRREALAGLAVARQRAELAMLLEIIGELDDQSDVDQTVVVDLVHLLAMRPTDELADAREEIQQLATNAKQRVLREIAFATLIEVDGSIAPAWKLATQSVATLNDFVHATPWVSNPSLRAKLYPKLEPLLKKLPGLLSAVSNMGDGPMGRYVRITIPKKATLTLAEVEVYSDDRNIARKGKTSQKNTASGGAANRAIDGNTSGSYGGGGQTHTAENTANPWWEVDLGEELPIDRIVVYNRTDGSLGKRLDGFTLAVLNGQRDEVFRQEGIAAPSVKVAFTLEGGGSASRVRRASMLAMTHVRGKETATFNILASFTLDQSGRRPGAPAIDADRLAAIRAMQRIGPKFWNVEHAQPLLNVMIDQVRGTPTDERTSPATLDVMELADNLASLLPVEQARSIRGELRDLGVRVIRIGTLPERMAYDKDLIAVAAGKPVEFMFQNDDLMPHNFVITQPGALEEVGLLAEATAQQPGALERHYIPPSDKLLLSSRLLHANQSQKLSFTAPKQPGVYPYVCTYPGHWRRMYGALYVIEDIDAYLADPEEYLSAHPLPILDALLKDHRPRTEWKFDDLAEVIGRLGEGHSLGNAKQMFQVANCVACHRLNDVGQQVGPDLTKLDEKYKPLDILRELLEPSARINEKYQTWIFVTDAGRVVTGLVLEETPDTVKVIENPLAKAEPVVLRKSEIDDREKSNVSIMPKGLLDKLTREEILDLIAYIAARGDTQHDYFQGHHAGHGAASGGQ